MQEGDRPHVVAMPLKRQQDPRDKSLQGMSWWRAKGYLAEFPTSQVGHGSNREFRPEGAMQGRGQALSQLYSLEADGR